VAWRGVNLQRPTETPERGRQGHTCRFRYITLSNRHSRASRRRESHSTPRYCTPPKHHPVSSSRSRVPTNDDAHADADGSPPVRGDFRPRRDTHLRQRWMRRARVQRPGAVQRAARHHRPSHHVRQHWVPRRLEGGGHCTAKLAAALGRASIVSHKRLLTKRTARMLWWRPGSG